MLDCFFNPQSVAVIGASNNESKGGYDIIKNVMAGFRGKIYPVNKSYTEILGILMLSRCGFDSRQYRPCHIFHTVQSAAGNCNRMREKRRERNHHRIGRLQRSRR